jgi:hypothetical protein
VPWPSRMKIVIPTSRVCSGWLLSTIVSISPKRRSSRPLRKRNSQICRVLKEADDSLSHGFNYETVDPKYAEVRLAALRASFCMPILITSTLSSSRTKNKQDLILIHGQCLISVSKQSAAPQIGMRMAALGHEERFPPPNLSASFSIAANVKPRSDRRRRLALRLTCHTGLSLLFEVGGRPPHDGIRSYAASKHKCMSEGGTRAAAIGSFATTRRASPHGEGFAKVELGLWSSAARPASVIASASAGHSPCFTVGWSHLTTYPALRSLLSFEYSRPPLAVMVNISRHSSDTRSVGPIFRLIEAPRNEIPSQPAPLAIKSSGCPPRRAETRCVAFIKAHLCCRRLSHLTRSPGHAGAGGGRSRAISDRISWNICRGTATSAIWNVT